VWHLHLTYTQSYWNELCSKVLKKPLHHSPTKGGRSESKKYRSQYQATLDSYTSTFGKAPPIDIWPDRQQRFNQADRFVRLNKSDYLLLKKPPKSLLVATTLPLLLAACVNTQISSLTAGTVFSGLLAIAAVYGVYKLITLRKSISPTKNKSNPDVSHSTDPSPDSVRDQNWFARRYAAMMGAYVGFSNNFGGDNGGGGNDSGCGGGCGGSALATTIVATTSQLLFR